MKADPADRDVLRRFLLGELSDDAREAIEEHLMTDDAYFEQFELVKEELIDEYAEGEMSRKERKKFEEKFLTSATRRRHLRMAQALMPHSPVRKNGSVSIPSGFSLIAWLRSFSS